MRMAFYGLLLVNLVVLAWSSWLAPAPAAPPAAAVQAASPAPRKILLANERPAASAVAAPLAADGTAGAGAVDAGGATGMPLADADPATDPANPAATATVPAAAAAALVPAVGDAASGAGAGSGSGAGNGAGTGTAAPVAARVTPVVATAPAVATPLAAASAKRCASMGPFDDAEMTAQALQMLKQDGYEPRQRSAKGAVPDSYMVVIRRLKGEADQARVVARLNRGGLDDAFAIPKLDDGYAVSVGLFSQSRRAERRAVAVGRMGFKAEIVERTRPGTVYWLDFDLKAPATGSADPFAKTADPNEKVQVVPCPANAGVG